MPRFVVLQHNSFISMFQKCQTVAIQLLRMNVLKVSNVLIYNILLFQKVAFYI